MFLAILWRAIVDKNIKEEKSMLYIENESIVYRKHNTQLLKFRILHIEKLCAFVIYEKFTN